jgi:hypothetical protein
MRIHPVVLTAQELPRSEKFVREFLSLVREGIIYWGEMGGEVSIFG